MDPEPESARALHGFQGDTPCPAPGARNLDRQNVRFDGAAKAAGVDEDLLARAVAALSGAGNLAVVIGPTVFQYDANSELIDALRKIHGRG